MSSVRYDAIVMPGEKYVKLWHCNFLGEIIVHHIIPKIEFGICVLYFGPRVYPRGSLVIAFVRPLARWSVCPSLNISETVHLFFLGFCMKLGHHKGTKVTELDF